MKEYIDKAAVKAEIERQMQEYQSTGDDYWFPVIENQKNILSFLNTLEVKDVDLEKEIENELKRTWYGEYLDTDKFKESAVYFYELGLKA